MTTNSVVYDDVFDGVEHRPAKLSTSTLRRMHSRLAEALWRAEVERLPADSLTALFPHALARDAQAVRREVDLLRMASGAVPIGRRVGFGSPGEPVPNAFSEPWWAYVFSSACHEGYARTPHGQWLTPRVAPCLALRAASDLTNPEMDDDALDRAFVSIAPAFEILDSRAGHWQISELDAVADSGLHGKLILGEFQGWNGFDGLQTVTARLSSPQHRSYNRVARLSSQRRNPLVVARRLGRELISSGEPLRAGEIVLTGSLLPPTPVGPGETWWAEFTGFGRSLVVLSVTLE
jgi:2-keto-4-pentenoate hydratase